MTHDSQSTPITAEGLRGLGFDNTAFMNALRMPVIAGHLWATQYADQWAISVNSNHLGHAPDLETVGRLIEVLRRMNGEGSHDDN